MKIKGTRGVVLLCAVLGLVMIYVGMRFSEPKRMETPDLTREMVGTQVLLSGRVMDAYEHPNGHLFLQVGEENRTVSVPLFSSVRRGMKDRVEMLDWVEVKGKVKEWKGKLEVVPGGARDLRVRRTPPLEVREVGEEEVGKLVKVVGEVRKVVRLRENSLLLTLGDGNSELKLFLPFRVEVEVGSRLVAAGRVQVYRGELELVVKRSSNLYL